MAAVQPSFYEKKDYIETSTGNKVSRKSVLCGTSNIRLKGKSVIKPGAMVRGDLAGVSLGRYVYLESQVVLRPPCKKYKGGIAFFPMTIGDYTIVGEKSVVGAVTVGAYVQIGKNCVIGKRCILKDCCKIADNSVVPPDTVVAPFSVYKGYPAVITEELPECFADMQRDLAIKMYDQFHRKQEEPSQPPQPSQAQVQPRPH